VEDEEERFVVVVATKFSDDNDAAADCITGFNE